MDHSFPRHVIWRVHELVHHIVKFGLFFWFHNGEDDWRIGQRIEVKEALNKGKVFHFTARWNVKMDIVLIDHELIYDTLRKSFSNAALPTKACFIPQLVQLNSQRVYTFCR